MKTIIHKAATRGHADHGWLNTYHTFSFAGYHDQERIHFGALRVLNDDWVQGGEGFGTHAHDNMEIVTIPWEGALEHKDSMGNKGVIRKGDVQVMSAGTGIHHSEYNHNADHAVAFLQIWLFPNKRNVQPRYDQMSYAEKIVPNKFQTLIVPEGKEGAMWLHQDAWFHLGVFEKDSQQRYTFKKEGNGLYVFVLKGSVSIEDTTLEKRDGMGIWEANDLELKIMEDGTELLLMEVPMVI